MYQTELNQMCNTVLAQNYFQFNNSYYVQKTGLAMGAPTSSIFPEIYLQYLENTTIYNIRTKHKIIGYFRYVDDILIVSKDKNMDIYEVLNSFNNLSLTLLFTIEEEKDNTINFVDILLYKTNNINFRIYRKPTTTDLIIPHDSNHSHEYKTSAIRYLANWLITYPLNNDEKNEEYNTQQHILCNNRYNPIQLDNIITSINTKTHSQHQSQTIQKKNWPDSPMLAHKQNTLQKSSRTPFSRLLTKPLVQYKNYYLNQHLHFQ